MNPIRYTVCKEKSQRTNVEELTLPLSSLFEVQWILSEVSVTLKMFCW